MKHHTNTYRTLFGAGCLAFATMPVLAGNELANEGARVLLGQPEAATLDEPANADNWFLSGWEGSFELGLTGASGNNERFNFRAGAAASREDDKSADQVSLMYSYATDDGTQTENRFAAAARHDWKFADSPWRVYIGGTYEYDEFQDWDHRLSFGPGVGYQAIKNDRTDLLLRAGLVATKEFGGADNDWTPEADLGFDLEHKLTERQTLTVVFDLYPSLKNTGEFRFVGDAGWQIELDPEANLYLKLGVEDRYDSTPGPDKKKNDIAYYATIGWSF